MSSKKIKLEELSYKDLEILKKQIFWNIYKEKNKNKKEKLTKFKHEITDELYKFYDIEYLYVNLDKNGNLHLCYDDIDLYYIWSKDLFTDELVKLIDISTDKKLCDYIISRKNLVEFIEENNLNVEIKKFRKEELNELFNEIKNQYKLTKSFTNH